MDSAVGFHGGTDGVADDDYGGYTRPRAGDAQHHDLLDILTIALAAPVCGGEGGGVPAIGGKTLRCSFDRAAGRSPLHVVTAFRSSARLAIGRQAVAPGENEILAARALLGTLALDGVLATGDAIHTQAETANCVPEKGGDRLFALKANRPAMLAGVTAFFADPPAPPSPVSRPNAP